MHRAYQSITPANNKLLKKRWDMTTYDMHRTKVHQASAVIDNRPPAIYLHLHLKLKKMQIEEERLATVERDNRILLEKMSYIMRTKGLVDNRNVYEHKSLNKTKRQRALLRVSHENQAILKRISSKEPHLNHLYWEEEWKMNKRYMDNITMYPFGWYNQVDRKTKSPVKKNIASRGSRVVDEDVEENHGTARQTRLPTPPPRKSNDSNASSASSLCSRKSNSVSGKLDQVDDSL